VEVREEDGVPEEAGAVMKCKTVPLNCRIYVGVPNDVRNLLTPTTPFAFLKKEGIEKPFNFLFAGILFNLFLR